MSPTLRQLWDAGEPTIGGWCSIPAAFSAELMGRCGFDWVCVDTQHGLIGYDVMASMLQALSITKTPPFVRVPWNQPDHIMKALDGGAQGVVVPMVDNAEQARQAVDAAKYPPLGSRSWGPTRAAFELGPDYSPESANHQTIVAPMIETPDGFTNLDEILAVPGVSAVYVGPSDLAVSHGIKFGDSEHTRMIEHIADRCQHHGIVAGIHCDRIETVHRWRDVGYRMFTVASDAVFMRQGATAVAQGAFGPRAEQPTTTAPRASNYA